MITNNGKIAFLDSVAGRKNGFASSLALGISNTAATVNDTSLGFLITSVPIATTIVDYVNHFIYLKATLPASDQYTIKELGCYNSTLDTAHSGPVLTYFGQSTNWTDTSGVSTIDATDTLTGVGSRLYGSLAANAVCKGYAPLLADLSSLADNTQFKISYYSNNMLYAKWRFKVDDSNYYETSLSGLGGWPSISVTNKSAFVATGTPSWASINYIEVEGKVNSSGTGSVAFDVCRYDIPPLSNIQLLGHVILPTPQVKLTGVTMDVEYKLAITI